MADALAFGYLETTDVGETTEVLIAAEAVARASNPHLADRIHGVIIGLLDDVNRVAVEMTGASEGIIIQKIFETRNAQRPLTGNLESHIVSKPGPLGLVEVGILAELEKIVNPRGYGTFWRAQEYGTGVTTAGGEIPTQIGRLLPTGLFQPSGSPPDPGQQGLGRGKDAAFVPDRNAAEASAARITVDLPARHFMRDGFADASVAYLSAMDAVRVKWDTEIQGCIDEMVRAQQSAARSFHGTIVA